MQGKKREKGVGYTETPSPLHPPTTLPLSSSPAFTLPVTVALMSLFSCLLLMGFLSTVQGQFGISYNDEVNVLNGMSTAARTFMMPLLQMYNQLQAGQIQQATFQSAVDNSLMSVSQPVRDELLRALNDIGYNTNVLFSAPYNYGTGIPYYDPSGTSSGNYQNYQFTTTLAPNFYYSG